MPHTYPAGPQGIPLIGSGLDFMLHTFPFIQEAARSGDISHFRIGPKDAFLLNSAEYVYDVLVKNPEPYHKDELSKKAGRKLVGNGLILMDGDDHRRERKAMQGAFHYQRLQGYFQTMLEYTQRMLDRWQDGEAIHVEDEMLFVTLCVISKALMNADVSDTTDAVAQAITAYQRAISIELRGAMMIPDWLPLAHKRAMKRSIQTLDGIVRKILTEHQQMGNDQGDFISMLLEASRDDPRLTAQQIRDETMTMFVIGHETTANLLTWALYLLATHPDVQAKLQAEVDSVLGDGTFTVDDLARLEYTSLILKETLRLYPPLWLTNRSPIDDVSVGGYTIRKGQLIFFSPYLLHHDPRYFENPEAFQPERFAGDFEKRLPRLCYFPFGAGPRVCIGQHLATMEATVVLALMAQRYAFHRPDPNADAVRFNALITLRPQEPLYLLTRRRHGAFKVS